jgi:hypothetical protein
MSSSWRNTSTTPEFRSWLGKLDDAVRHRFTTDSLHHLAQPSEVVVYSYDRVFDVVAMLAVSVPS